MKTRLLIKIVWSLAILGVGYGSVIINQTLDSRLCRGLFVFKFHVLSSPRNIGCAGSPLKSVDYLINTTLTSPPPTTETTTSTTTTSSSPTASSTTTGKRTTTARATSQPAKANKTTGKTSNLHRILSTQPGPPRQQLTNLSTPSSFQTRRKRSCHQIQAQLISIRGDGIFKGKDTLKRMSNVVESKLKDNYYSCVRFDLNWEKELSSGDYLFIGRIRGIFLSNPATVVPWDKTLEKKIKNFDFGTNCPGAKALTYDRIGLLDPPAKAWSQDGGNMRVFAHEVTC